MQEPGPLNLTPHRILRAKQSHLQTHLKQVMITQISLDGGGSHLKANGVFFVPHRHLCQHLHAVEARKVNQLLSGHVVCEQYLDCIQRRASPDFKAVCPCFVGNHTLEGPHHMLMCEDQDIARVRDKLLHTCEGDLSIPQIIQHLPLLSEILTLVSQIWASPGRA